ETDDRPRRRGGARRCELAVGMRHALHCERRDQDRQRNVGPDDRRRRRDGADVDEHAWPELATLERGKVVAKRDLVPRPAGKVSVRVRFKLRFGDLLVIPDVDRAGHESSVTLTVRTCLGVWTPAPRVTVTTITSRTARVAP